MTKALFINPKSIESIHLIKNSNGAYNVKIITLSGNNYNNECESEDVANFFIELIGNRIDLLQIN